MSGKREYGDYQTPIDFAERLCLFLKDYCRIKPSAVIEPTCGVGNILKSSLLFQADEYYGIEINPDYCAICRTTADSAKITIINADFFAFSSKSLVKNKRQILVIGNPPWVNNSTLSLLNSKNLPIKSNVRGLKGIEAITGASNFDICEYIIMQLIQEYRATNAVIAMLCKTSVARNVFGELKRSGIAYETCEIFEFEASRVFGINASACLLLIRLSENETSSDICSVYDFERPEAVKFRLGYVDGKLSSNFEAAAESFDGRCRFEWRQGVKHDCSRIMELTLRNGVLQNGQKETVQIEDALIFPLIKSSMFKAPVIHSFSKFVIVTQRKIRENTERLEKETPKAWQYLNDNIEHFNCRKSSVYRGAPPFSMFGVGDYSYAEYKVGVSGFYKKPLFSLLYSDDKKPVMTDDTSYFICFDSYDMAYVAMLLLNSDKVQDFLTRIAFLDAKRPYTKKVLERIDFEKIVGALSTDELTKTERKLNLPFYVSSYRYEAFKSLLNLGQLKLA